MRTFLTVVCFLTLIASAFAATCSSDVGVISQKYQDLLVKISNNCDTTNIDSFCNDGSQCRQAITDLFSYVEDCATQLSGTDFGAQFSLLVDQWEQAVEVACGANPIDLFSQYFAGCSNVDKLVDAAQKVLNNCNGVDTCSDACRSSLSEYYKQLYNCVSPDDENVNQESIRQVFEHLCELVTPAQSCVQTLYANLHIVNDKCTNSGSFQCSTDCEAAISSAFATASAYCPLDAADILSQYESACSGDCGVSVDGSYSSISEACSPLSGIAPSSDECTACATAIADAKTTAACLSLVSTSSDDVLNLLSVLATRACAADIPAKTLTDEDVFGSKSRNVAAACRSGICDSECEDAISSLVSTVKDAYSPLSLPDSVSDAIAEIKAICNEPAPGFPHRIDVVLSDIDCSVVLNYAQDYIFRFAQLFGLSPADLVIVDCATDVTRATETSLTMGSSNSPKKVSASDCSDVSLTCTKVSSSSTSGSGSGSSSASTLFLSSFLVAVSMIALWFF